jgi:hypothetical protein
MMRQRLAILSLMGRLRIRTRPMAPWFSPHRLRSSRHLVGRRQGRSHSVAFPLGFDAPDREPTVDAILFFRVTFFLPIHPAILVFLF